ncbi:hypothetical protein DM860_009974 [Cuscuta australis]|uniref:Uncharacterized protein n=1 Tax=Cuscuta australis TaxID=267555 RepID=A0A328DBF9_9ASTE|nr:hypothetical protein DM860_009974 [Cuscuta australis]
MAKAFALISAFCFLAAVANAASESFTVSGNVYCDPCRVKFKTRISENVPNAVVRLECRNMTTDAVTYSKEATTGENGFYTIDVEGEFGNDICDVTALKSSREDCKDTRGRVDKSQIVISNNAGMHNTVRYANPLFFTTEKASPQCPQVLKEIDYVPIDKIM